MQRKPPYTQFVSAEIFPKQAVAGSIHSVSAARMFSYSPLLDNYLYNKVDPISRTGLGHY